MSKFISEAYGNTHLKRFGWTQGGAVSLAIALFSLCWIIAGPTGAVQSWYEVIQARRRRLDMSRESKGDDVAPDHSDTLLDSDTLLKSFWIAKSFQSRTGVMDLIMCSPLM
jgi:hypothetical protein